MVFRTVQCSRKKCMCCGTVLQRGTRMFHLAPPFMKVLKKGISRRANRGDDCMGHFRAARYRDQRLPELTVGDGQRAARRGRGEGETGAGSRAMALGYGPEHRGSPLRRAAFSVPSATRRSQAVLIRGPLGSRIGRGRSKALPRFTIATCRPPYPIPHPP